MKALINILFVLAIFAAPSLSAQPICTPWGNINGILVDGEKMEIETSLRSVYPDWSGYVKTEKYNWEGHQTFIPQGKSYIVSHYLQSTPIGFTIKNSETATGKAKAEIEIKANKKHSQAGTYFCAEVLYHNFATGKAEFYLKGSLVKTVNMDNATKNTKGEIARIKANKVVISSKTRQYEIETEQPAEIILRSDFFNPPAYLNDPVPHQSIIAIDEVTKNANFQFYFTIIDGEIKKGFTKKLAYSISTSGDVDKQPVSITIDPEKPGRKFDGIGGNFRLQFPDKDPAVIQYCLDSLNVTWARVPLFWDEYHPSENAHPDELLKAGKLSPNFYNQIELTKKLAQSGAKMILAIWTPPAWAIDTTIKVPKGVVLNNNKLDKIGESIAAYLLYLKGEHGIEFEYFSFNEPDYGVEVYHNPQNHLIQNKAIGLCFAKHGLKTKILIADTGAGTAKARNIISEIEKDSQMHQYSGAIAFHTYHGCTNNDLNAWAQAANASNLPIMVAEGGTNSAAHRFAMIFLEPWFQLEEIDYYIRICNICQPVTILEWQLTADYSPLIGMGLYNDNGPLRPTQRYWNLKQLSLSSGQFALPTQCNKSNVSVASFGNQINGAFTLHAVNNGANRVVNISGIPANIKSLNLFLTNAVKGMEYVKTVAVSNGVASFELEASTYATLVSAN